MHSDNNNTTYTRLEDKPALTIGAASKLTGLHQQTLRVWEQRGLIVPARTPKGTRLYSLSDVERLRRIADLSAEGVTVRGIEHIFELENRISSLVLENVQLKEQIDKLSRVIDAMRVAEAQSHNNVSEKPIPRTSADEQDTDISDTNLTPYTKRLIAIRKSVGAVAFLPDDINIADN